MDKEIIWNISSEGVKRLGATLIDLADYYEMRELAFINPDALAEEIEHCASFDQEMSDNGYFDHELGFRTPRGDVMTLAIYPTDCNQIEFMEN